MMLQGLVQWPAACAEPACARTWKDLELVNAATRSTRRWRVPSRCAGAKG
jgi:hypothetical protein